MPKGPQGQKRPADSIGCAVKVAKIAIGDESDIISPKNRAKSSRAGGNARAAKLTREERRQIAKTAADARWNNGKDGSMSNTAQSPGATAQQDRVVQMYPHNQLREQVRDFEDTLSAFDVMKREFFERD